MKTEISVTILVKNSETTLAKTLDSVRHFSEVIVLDTGSTDQTIAIASSYSNVKVFYAPFEGFGPSHNRASSLATRDFILSLDSDEIVSPQLVEELQGMTLRSDAVYAIERRNYFRGKWIKGCSGWYPDKVVRLYCRNTTSFDEAMVHEKVIQGSLQKIDLTHPMDHIPYRRAEDFLRKMQMYTSLYAQQNRGKKRSSWRKALLHSMACFCKSYFIKKGFIFGFEGLFLSLYNGQTAFYKYVKLMEENENIAWNKDDRSRN